VHADFKRLVKGEKIEATVPLRLVGESIGVREQQGIIEQIVREVEIRCEPRDIPEHLDVDVTNLAVHDVLRVSDIPTSAGIEILESPDAVIATVGVVKEEPVAVAPVEGEVPTEPEVIGKGKKEEEEEGEGEAEVKAKEEK
jgi:large subunit ribosomal protein L25